MKAVLWSICVGPAAVFLLILSGVDRCIAEWVHHSFVSIESLDRGFRHTKALTLSTAASLASLMAYELTVRPWKPRRCLCRRCRSVLRNLREPRCPQCGMPI